MVTLIIVWLLVFLIFMGIDDLLDTGGLVAILGFIIAVALGFVAAASVGDSFPTKTTTLMEQQLQVMEVGSAKNTQFYVQDDQSKKTYTYQADGSRRTVDSSDAKIVFEEAKAPYVEYIKKELNLPEGEGWKWLFGISGLPSDKMLIHVPQGSTYITK